MNVHLNSLHGVDHAATASLQPGPPVPAGGSGRPTNEEGPPVTLQVGSMSAAPDVDHGAQPEDTVFAYRAGFCPVLTNSTPRRGATYVTQSWSQQDDPNLTK